MQLNFADALTTLSGANTAFTIMNEARPPVDYLYNNLLPEQNRATYEAKAGTMTVRSTMAGVSGMDSAYSKVGAIQLSTMRERTIKVTSEALLDEETQRELQTILTNTAARNGGAVDQSFLRDEALNFLNKIIVQSHLDMAEWMRGQAIAKGTLAFNYNGIQVSAGYGIPAANILAQRTGTGRYGSTASSFWDDVRMIQQLLGYDVRAIMIHGSLLSEAITNAFNRIQVTSQDGAVFGLRRQVNDQGLLSSDNRDSVTIIAYNKEGEVYDTANPGQTIKIPFHPKTQMVGIGNGAANSPYVVGQGSTPTVAGALGYHHIAPTVEGGGTAGRWSRLYIPEGRPWQLVGQGVANELPIIDRPSQLVIASSLLMV